MILMRNAQRFYPTKTYPRRQPEGLLAEYELSYDKQQMTPLPEIVIGADEHLSVGFLEKGPRAQKSVARLLVRRISNVQPMGKPAQGVTGTGWRITPDLLLTNHHAIMARRPGDAPASNADVYAQAQRAVAWFGYRSWDAVHVD